MSDETSNIVLNVTTAEADILIAALDDHEYWQLGEKLPRNNGEVWIPGDLPAGEDRYWDGQVPTEEEESAIEAVRRCRELHDKVSTARWTPIASDGSPTTA